MFYVWNGERYKSIPSRDFWLFNSHTNLNIFCHIVSITHDAFNTVIEVYYLHFEFLVASYEVFTNFISTVNGNRYLSLN